MEPLTIQLSDLDATARLGARLGQVLEAKDFVGLVGPLGAGKTHFSRAVAAGLGLDPRMVSSPTYSLVQRHDRGRIPLQHWDWYRLRDEDDLLSTGFFDLLEQSDALLVEWVDRIPAAVPADWLRLELTPSSVSSRELAATAFGRRAAALLDRWMRET